MSKSLFKLLVIGNSYPHSAHAVRAANVVIYELLRALARKADCQVGYLIVRRSVDPDPTEIELEGLLELKSVGVEVLKPIKLPKALESRSAFFKFFSTRRSDFYPDSVYADYVFPTISQFSPNMLIVPWSEWLTALCSDFGVKKFAYYGNPDHKSAEWRLSFDRRHGILQSSWLRSKIALSVLEKEHLKVMNQYELIGNVAANDAAYYKHKGHPHSFYIQNIWIDRFANTWRKKREAAFDPSKPLKIIANIGQLGGTANRYGLEILGKSVAPKLRELMSNFPYELHIIGKGELIPSLKRLLNSEEIKIRGFVDDVDQEMFESAIFLCLNNAGPFKVGHTRYLHAWSLGMCVVAHRDAALSMPEMQHRKNCLLGSNLNNIAELVHEACLSKELRDRIGDAGYETFTHHFKAEAVSDRVWNFIDEAAN